MNFSEFMNKVRQWDNLLAKWIVRHFYFVFFQIILVVIFICWFINTTYVISNIGDVNNQPTPPTPLEQILVTQSVNTTLVVFLLLLNCFWVLFIFNGLQRVQLILRDLSYSLGRFRDRNPNPPKK